MISVVKYQIITFQARVGHLPAMCGCYCMFEQDSKCVYKCELTLCTHRELVSFAVAEILQLSDDVGVVGEL